MRCIIYNQIHTRQALYLMQLVASLVDVAIFRHKNAYFMTSLLYALGQLATCLSKLVFGHVRCHFLGYK